MAESVAVSPDNFARAESDMYFARFVNRGASGQLLLDRELSETRTQTVVRSNRDVLAALGVFDLDAGPVTITLPDTGGRFMSLMVISEDHFIIETTYDPGDHAYTRHQAGTRYLWALIRIVVNGTDPADIAAVHRLQDAIAVSQPGGPGRFEVPSFEQGSQGKVRDALLALARTVPDTRHMFGSPDQVDPVRHLIGTAMGWGGNNERDAFYLTVYPPGTTVPPCTACRSATSRSTGSGRSRCSTPTATSSRAAATPTT